MTQPTSNDSSIDRPQNEMAKISPDTKFVDTPDPDQPRKTKKMKQKNLLLKQLAYF